MRITGLKIGRVKQSESLKLSTHTLKHVLCVNDCTPHPRQRAQLQSIQETLSYLQQSISGPLTKPVNGGAVDECWVLEEVFPEGKQKIVFSFRPLSLLLNCKISLLCYITLSQVSDDYI